MTLRLSALMVSLWWATALAFAAPPQTDPEMARLLEVWSSLRSRPLATMKATEARSQPSLLDAVPILQRRLGRPNWPPREVQVTPLQVAGAEGDLPALLYRPEGEGPFPILVYFHGGGWVVGEMHDYDASARALADAAKCLVLSVGYRQAPEHPFPAALHDAVAAYRDARTRATEWDGDPRRVAVGGEGAGANLATVVCRKALDDRLPAPIHQLLICPWVDTRFDRPSYQQHAETPPYGLATMRWFYQNYLRGGTSPANPYVAILRKTAVDTPSATIILAELDPARSEGEAYHQHLLASAVDSQMALYRGVTADFFGTGTVVGKARQASEFAGGRLRRAFELRRPYRR